MPSRWRLPAVQRCKEQQRLIRFVRHSHQLDGKSFNIKITTPQIIGYYLQATPADKSTIIDEISDEETAAGFVTISKFVEDYKKLLQAMNKKNNAEQQN